MLAPPRTLYLVRHRRGRAAAPPVERARALAACAGAEMHLWTWTWASEAEWVPSWSVASPVPVAFSEAEAWLAGRARWTPAHFSQASPFRALSLADRARHRVRGLVAAEGLLRVSTLRLRALVGGASWVPFARTSRPRRRADPVDLARVGVRARPLMRVPVRGVADGAARDATRREFRRGNARRPVRAALGLGRFQRADAGWHLPDAIACCAAEAARAPPDAPRCTRRGRECWTVRWGVAPRPGPALAASGSGWCAACMAREEGAALVTLFFMTPKTPSTKMPPLDFWSEPAWWAARYVDAIAVRLGRPRLTGASLTAAVWSLRYDWYWEVQSVAAAPTWGPVPGLPPPPAPFRPPPPPLSAAVSAALVRARAGEAPWPRLGPRLSCEEAHAGRGRPLPAPPWPPFPARLGPPPPGGWPSWQRTKVLWRWPH